MHVFGTWDETTAKKSHKQGQKKKNTNSKKEDQHLEPATPTLLSTNPPCNHPTRSWKEQITYFTVLCHHNLFSTAIPVKCYSVTVLFWFRLVFFSLLVKFLYCGPHAIAFTTPCPHPTPIRIKVSLRHCSQIPFRNSPCFDTCYQNDLFKNRICTGTKQNNVSTSNAPVVGASNERCVALKRSRMRVRGMSASEKGGRGWGGAVQ